MSLIIPTRNFPNFGISKQLFHVPGAVIDGGFTSGGVRVTTPDIGGFGRLMIQPSLTNEDTFPLSSWVMSGTNGRVFRTRLARTPQIARPAVALDGVSWDTGLLWSNQQKWQGDINNTYLTTSLEGSTALTINMSVFGQILQTGHVIGHKYDCYLIDDISYDGANIATLTVIPPLRRDVTAGDDVIFRPWFTGQIDNSQDFFTTYDAEMNGHIQLNMITLNEVIL